MTGEKRPPPGPVLLPADDFDAVIFDLDGVVTKTARAHASAWKQLFDNFLERNAAETGKQFEPFDEERDYRAYVDGKPRYDGVRSFLAARGIELPEGTPDDPPDKQTVCGLGNAKNRAFLDHIETAGVESYPSTVRLVEKLKSVGKQVAIISSSRNCKAVLEAAGLAHQFDARVDGVESDRRSLAGKPAPDIFLAAADVLSVSPSRAIVVEDAVAGVAAGRAGGFALVIGVDRMTSPEDLYDAGADVVVADLEEINMTESGLACTGRTTAVPDALDRINEIRDRLSGRRLAVFLDYDGTLTPIVDNPADATLPPSMRETLKALSASVPVAVVSGRARADVEALVGVSSVIVAGSHGFDVELPDGQRVEHEGAEDFKRAVADATRSLETALAGVPGVIIENKTFDVAVHYRLVPPHRHDEVETAVDRAAAAAPVLRKSRGKMVFELLPDIAWDKGRAVLWLLRSLGLDGPEFLPLYIGDDKTDADAFRALKGRGISIFVEGETNVGGADYRLRSPADVEEFLRRLGNSPRAGRAE